MWLEIKRFFHSILMRNGKALGWAGFSAGLTGFLAGAWYLLTTGTTKGDRHV